MVESFLPLHLEYWRFHMKASLRGTKSLDPARTMLMSFPGMARPVMCLPRSMERETQENNPCSFGASLAFRSNSDFRRVTHPLRRRKGVRGLCRTYGARNLSGGVPHAYAWG